MDWNKLNTVLLITLGVTRYNGDHDETCYFDIIVRRPATDPTETEPFSRGGIQQSIRIYLTYMRLEECDCESFLVDCFMCLVWCFTYLFNFRDCFNIAYCFGQFMQHYISGDIHVKGYHCIWLKSNVDFSSFVISCHSTVSFNFQSIIVVMLRIGLSSVHHDSSHCLSIVFWNLTYDCLQLIFWNNLFIRDY